jgi:hypothetical protein
MASWRRLDQSRRGAIKIGGSPFTTFVEAAEDACNVTLKNLTRLNDAPAVNARAAGGQDFCDPWWSEL